MRQQPRIRQNSTIPFGISPPSGEILEEQILPGALKRLRKQNVLQHELWVNVVVEWFAPFGADSTIPAIQGSIVHGPAIKVSRPNPSFTCFESSAASLFATFSRCHMSLWRMYTPKCSDILNLQTISYSSNLLSVSRNPH